MRDDSVREKEGEQQEGEGERPRTAFAGQAPTPVG